MTMTTIPPEKAESLGRFLNSFLDMHDQRIEQTKVLLCELEFLDALHRANTRDANNRRDLTDLWKRQKTLAIIWNVKDAAYLTTGLIRACKQRGLVTAASSPTPVPFVWLYTGK